MSSGKCDNCSNNGTYVRQCKHCGTKICAHCTSSAVSNGGKCPSCNKVGLKPV